MCELVRIGNRGPLSKASIKANSVDQCNLDREARSTYLQDAVWCVVLWTIMGLLLGTTAWVTAHWTVKLSMPSLASAPCWFALGFLPTWTAEGIFQRTAIGTAICQRRKTFAKPLIISP